ncbi:7-carboxy-7-deazaguanine synthase QueE [Geitlerinema splendidum]|nr:7-carboxy-7-deazaguanine synthase QueE [Geitlerinema splendidum]
MSTKVSVASKKNHTNDALDQIKLVFTNDEPALTIQGEGKYCGVPSVFVRLSGCNLRCEWIEINGRISSCDTPYSSHFPEKNIQTISEAISKIAAFNCKHLVITGGEPFMNPNVVHLIRAARDIGRYVSVETNGTYSIDDEADFLSISPKLSTSIHKKSKNYESHESKRLNFQTLSKLVKRHHQLKFVINEEKEIEEVKEIIRTLTEINSEYDVSNVYLSPQGIDINLLSEKLKWMAEVAKYEGWNITDRLHIRIWGEMRGI